MCLLSSMDLSQLRLGKIPLFLPEQGIYSHAVTDWYRYSTYLYCTCTVFATARARAAAPENLFNHE